MDLYSGRGLKQLHREQILFIRSVNKESHISGTPSFGVLCVFLVIHLRTCSTSKLRNENKFRQQGKGEWWILIVDKSTNFFCSSSMVPVKYDGHLLIKQFLMILHGNVVNFYKAR